jgi:GNAT superfamily N-acetyltransferase
MRRTDGPALSPKSVAPHVVFGEATDDQWLPCNMLAASAFGEPLSPAGYLKREKFMSQQTLARDDGVRTWCLFRNDDRGYVLATCKTVRRQLLVTDGGGTYEGNGYCIATVVTHPSHRGQGHASTLLHNVAQWLDGPGQAIASMIYSNKETVSSDTQTAA